MKRRILAWVLALSLLISVLPLNVFAAEAGTEVLPAAIGDTTITLWTYPIGGWGGSQDLDQLIAGFTEENPGITVRVEHLDYMTGDSRVNEAIANGTTPDLILEGPERLVADWGARGVMADLSGLLDDEDRQEIYPEALKAGYGKDGKLYQYPLCGMVHTMAINKTVFEAAGAMQYINQDTRTWKSTEDFFKAVQAVYDDTNMTVGNIYCGGRGGDQGTRALVNNLYGGTYTDAAHTRYTWDSEANMAALNALCNCAGLEFNSQMVGGNEIAMLRNGTLNMAFCWNIAQQNMSGVTENGDEIMFLAFPSDDTPRLASGLWGFGAFDNGDAARLEAAKTFIRYMCDSEATADAVRTSGYFAVRDTAAGNDLTDIWADDPVMDAYAGLMPMLGDYYVVTPNWGAARDCWWQMLQDVGHGRDIAEATAYWTGTANGTYSEKTELTVIAAMYSGDTASWWGQFEADFEMAHSDVDLIVDVYDWGSIYSEVNTRIQTGQAPDILNIDGYENYLGMLLPVPAYMSWETYSKFYPEFLAQSEMDGQIWAVPDIASTRGLYYNADLLGEIGLAVPTTFGELMEACAAIKKAYGDDVIPWGLDVSANDAQSAFALYTWAAGGGFLDENGYWALNSEPNKEVLYYAVDLYENGYTNGTDLTSYDLREMFANGQVAMTVAPDSFRAWLDTVPGMNYGVANIIGNGMNPSHSIGVMDRIMCFDNNYSPEELAAVTAFFDFFYEDVRYANWARMEGFLPATSGGMDYLAETDPDMAVWGDILENARFYPTDKAEWITVKQGVINVIGQALNGWDPGQLLDELQAQFGGGQEIPSGSCGENLSWTLTDGTLRVFGTGPMYDYPENGSPWLEYIGAINTIYIEDGVTSIGNSAFAEIGYVDSIYISDTVTYIGERAFERCNAVDDIQIGNGVQTIAYRAFSHCANKQIVIPASVKHIHEHAFVWSMFLEEIVFLGDAPTFGRYIAPIDSVDTEVFLYAGTDSGIVAYYPAHNSTWTDDVFQDYGSTGTITWVPYGEPVIEEIASGWSGVTQWTLTSDGVLTVYGEGAMKNYGYNGGQPWLNKGVDIVSMVIEEGVTSVGSGAFRNLTTLKSVTFPESLTKMGEAAFYGSGLESVEIPGSLWTIQPYTFKNCINLEYVWFQEGNLQKISDGAFYGTGLTELYLPDCLDILDVYAFKNCPKLAYIQIGSGLTELREAVFYGTAITEITIPEGITKIGPYAFKNCVNLEAVELPQSLTSVGEAAFYADTALKTVELPDGVTTIGNYAFRKCEAIENLTLSAELVTVGECAFYGCTSLTELVIPDKVTTIMPYAFKTCTGLTSVTLGKKVTSIGEGAFNTCTGLKTIVFPASLKTIGDYCFSGSYNLWKLTFQGNAPAIGIGAFKGLAATAYYPAGNATWTSTVMQNYGGKITWKAN